MKGGAVSRSVKTTYRKAGSTPSARQKPAQSVTEGISKNNGSPLAPLARYISENEGTGIPISELTEQFRELDCEHLSQQVMWENSKAKFLGCNACGQITEVAKPGVK
jgi:hypothetical protein